METQYPKTLKNSLEISASGKEAGCTILHTWFDLWAVFFSWEGRRLAGNICLNANSAVASKNFKQRDYAKRGSAKHEGSF